MCGDQHFRFPENFIQGKMIVHQHIARGGAHKDLNTADIFFAIIGVKHFVGIIIGSAHEKRIIGQARGGRRWHIFLPVLPG